MDHSTPIEAPFSASFPLPFRALFLGGAGILCWATNLHGLHRLGVDVAAALDLRAHDAHARAPLRLSSAPPDALVLARAVYRLLAAYTACSFFGWAVFRLCTRGDPALIDVYKFLPAVTALALLMIVISPFNILEKRLRDQFLLAIRRCLAGPTNMPIHFSDVVLADIFTSFAKVIGDVWLSLCMIVPGGSLLIFPSQDGWARLVVPFLMSIPYLVRFRQCIIEYMLPTTTTKRPLYNALKYASSFPVIFLSAAQRIVTSDLIAQKGASAEENAWHGEHPLFRLWLLSVVVNSLYSYWWDVTNDWGLEFLQSKPKVSRQAIPRPLLLPTLHGHSSSTDGSSMHARHSSIPLQNGTGNGHADAHFTPNSAGGQRAYPWGLRPTLLFPLPAYPIAVFANLVLRLTWSLKLSAHLHAHTSGALVFFWLELAELVRRWVWVFFRVEWECVRRAGERAEHAPEVRDVMLRASGERLGGALDGGEEMEMEGVLVFDSEAQEKGRTELP